DDFVRRSAGNRSAPAWNRGDAVVPAGVDLPGGPGTAAPGGLLREFLQHAAMIEVASRAVDEEKIDVAAECPDQCRNSFGDVERVTDSVEEQAVIRLDPCEGHGSRHLLIPVFRRGHWSCSDDFNSAANECRRVEWDKAASAAGPPSNHLE